MHVTVAIYVSQCTSMYIIILGKMCPIIMHGNNISSLQRGIGGYIIYGHSLVPRPLLARRDNIHRLTKSAPGKVVAVKCDVTKEEDVMAVFEVAKAQFGGVDVCVNSAGVFHEAPLLSGATCKWRNMLEVYVTCQREYETYEMFRCLH